MSFLKKHQEGNLAEMGAYKSPTGMNVKSDRSKNLSAYFLLASPLALVVLAPLNMFANKRCHVELAYLRG